MPDSPLNAGEFSDSGSFSVPLVSSEVRTAWGLTRQLSPRDRVRVAAVDAYGRITNEFPGSGAPVAGDVPESTWAMMLADDDGLYRFLCFDLDAKNGRADVDARTLAIWLHDLGIPYVITESGPTGGRHVWIALDEGASSELVHQIGAFAKRMLPTLDLSQFNNVRTGAVRPPGAPHRDGGHSRIIEGHIGTLLHPTVDASDVARLHAHLAELVTQLPQPLESKRVRFVELDDAQRPTILSRGTRVPRLRPAPENGDASAIMASAIARYAHAGVPFEEVAAIAPTSPAFIHAFTERTPSGKRAPRPAQRAQRILERQWRRVTRWVDQTPEAFTAADPDFAPRALAIAQLVDALQKRADASPGRWARYGAGKAQSAGTGRYTDRLVLDALSYLALQAVKDTVEASARTLSAVCGVGRETARTALHRLQEDGWVTLVDSAEGPNASKWRLRDLSTEGMDVNRSQVFPPPHPEAGPALRNLHLENLGTKLSLQRHDAFAAPHSLGRTTGRVYAALRDDELLDLTEISLSTFLPARTIRSSLRQLHRYSLLEQTEGLWQRSPDNRDRAAEAIGVAGYLADREHRYSAEREAWAWWQSELEHRRARGRRRRKRHFTQLGLVTVAGAAPDFPIHPRRRDGRADFAAARHAVLAGMLTDELVASQPRTRPIARAA